jgi:ATP-dependent helicase/nuclease subunit A
MSEICWTKEQSDAITSRGGTLLVSAAAGSGKTAVLAERAVGLMLDAKNPVWADRLLIVTFTRAAAQQMKQRITERLAGRMAEEPDNALVKRQRVLIERAQIGTIHALCSDLLRQNMHLLSFASSFRVGDAQETGAMREQAVQGALEARYLNRQDAAFFLSWSSCSRAAAATRGLRRLFSGS